jgi:hypothetical protein
MQRHCAFITTPNGVFLELAAMEYGEREEADTYGPFADKEEALTFLEDNFANPGGWDEWEKSTAPTVSPNGNPIQKPLVKSMYECFNRNRGI